jgi:hypothetical protein
MLDLQSFSMSIIKSFSKVGPQCSNSVIVCNVSQLLAQARPLSILKAHSSLALFQDDI